MDYLVFSLESLIRYKHRFSISSLDYCIIYFSALLETWWKSYNEKIISVSSHMISLNQLLGLPNVSIEHSLEHSTEIILQLRMTSPEVTCPHCGSMTNTVNQNRPILIRDLPTFGRKVLLQVPRRQFRCSSCRRYFTEKLQFSDPDRNYTHRYEEYIYQQVKNSSLEQVSREEGISVDQARGIFDHVFEKRQAKKKPKGFGREKSA